MLERVHDDADDASSGSSSLEDAQGPGGGLLALAEEVLDGGDGVLAEALDQLEDVLLLVRVGGERAPR